MLHHNALKAYEQVEQDCMVAGANRHRLVEILFSELLGSIDRAILGFSTNDPTARSGGISKALTIVYALSSSLDFERGGDVAQSLAELYEWSRRQLIGSNKDRPIERLTEVRQAMADISEAWSSIANKAV